MLIHQDFSITGTGPMVEIYADRIEITNPGAPLIDVRRFLDLPPRSRNEALAAMMRRIGFCEERGSGIDKVLFEVELFQLPPPDFVVADQNVRAVLYSPRELSKMQRPDRIRACYQHASLRYLTGEPMTNASLRKRFSIEDQHHTAATRIISATVDSGWIKRANPGSESRKHASYVPFWA
jgi:predicted HTH transcriptional regulator